MLVGVIHTTQLAATTLKGVVSGCGDQAVPEGALGDCLPAHKKTTCHCVDTLGSPTGPGPSILHVHVHVLGSGRA